MYIYRISVYICLFTPGNGADMASASSMWTFSKMETARAVHIHVYIYTYICTYICIHMYIYRISVYICSFTPGNGADMASASSTWTFSKLATANIHSYITMYIYGISVYICLCAPCMRVCWCRRIFTHIHTYRGMEPRLQARPARKRFRTLRRRVLPGRRARRFCLAFDRQTSQ